MHEIEAVLAAYRDHRWRYDRLATLTCRFLVAQVDEVVGKRAVPVLQKFESRAKAPSSLRKNLEKEVEIERRTKKHRYRPRRRDTISLQNIGDLAAARMIFFFIDDLERFVAGPFRAWFGDGSTPERQLPFEHSEKGRELFGYDSYHADIAVKRGTEFFNTLAPSDQDELLGFRVEVQLRTLLQHAWAESEHDLRYKGPAGLPVELRRRWGMLAGMLDIGDVVLKDLKSEFLRHAPTGRSAPLPDAKGATRLVDAYEVLSRKPPQFSVDRRLYSVDEAVGVPGFKRSVLGQLPPRVRLGMSRDALITRMKRWDGRVAVVQPALYSDLLVTNHADAHKIRVNRATVASRACRRGVIASLNDSPMSNTIGVAAMIRTTDKEWVVPLRASYPAYEPDKFGCSVSGVLEWREPTEWQPDATSWWTERILDECLKELGFRPYPARVEFLALARERKRLGKPQIFLMMQVDATNRTVASYWKLNGDGEHVDLQFLKDDDARRAIKCETFRGKAVSLELRMNLALALDQLR